MSARGARPLHRLEEFRIPMRGYENTVFALPWEGEGVPNPHEGL